MLAACPGDPAPAGAGEAAESACRPSTCQQLHANCGTVDAGCGVALSCGSCTAPSTCGALPMFPHFCSCEPKSCEDQGKNCGEVSNGCGATLQCGSCAKGFCGGGGE